MTYNFLIPGIPIPKARHRTSKNRTYDPKSKEKAIMRIDLAFQSRNQGLLKPLDGEIWGDMIFYMPMPKSWSQKKRERVLRECTPHLVRPDCSNMCKMYEDAMNGIVYKDDSQITDLHFYKCYSDRPRTEITIKHKVKDERGPCVDADRRYHNARCKGSCGIGKPNGDAGQEG